MLLTIIIIQSYPIILYVGPESMNPCWFNVLCLIQLSPQSVHVSVVVHSVHTLVAEMEKDWNKGNKKSLNSVTVSIFYESVVISDSGDRSSQDIFGIHKKHPHIR